jgi:membrane-associated phospholipid phosphatase
MRSWFSRHPIWFMAFYLVFYLSVFHWLEANITVPEVWVHCRLDDLIPFCKYAVIPYFAWFVWIPFTLFYLLWKAPRADFWRLCLPLFAGMTIALAVYVVVPNGLDLRPYRVYGSDFFARTVRQLYTTDTATNVCPSIHVFNSVTLMMAYYRSRIFDEPCRRWMRPAAAVLCVSIIASTVLLKQHSCIDVVLGILLALVLDSAASSLERSEYRLPQRS